MRQELQRAFLSDNLEVCDHVSWDVTLDKGNLHVYFKVSDGFEESYTFNCYRYLKDDKPMNLQVMENLRQELTQFLYAIDTAVEHASKEKSD